MIVTATTHESHEQGPLSSSAASLHDVTFKAANDAIRKLQEVGILIKITGASYGRIFVCPQVRNIVLRP